MKTTTKEHETNSRTVVDGFCIVSDACPIDFGHVKRVSFDIHYVDGELAVTLSDYFLDEEGRIYGHDFAMSFISPETARAMAAALYDVAALAESK